VQAFLIHEMVESGDVAGQNNRESPHKKEPDHDSGDGQAEPATESGGELCL
jgi:hypothetical protein